MNSRPFGDYNKNEEEMKKIIEENGGGYDEQGFYVLPNGSFYDPYGYYFDEEGYDEMGGYYQEGRYYPGEGHEDEYYNRFEEENNIPETLEEEASRIAPFLEHVIPAIDWVQKQPEETKFTVQFRNVPSLVGEKRLKSYLDAIIDNLDEKGKFVFVKSKDPKKPNTGYFVTTDKVLVAKLLKQHMKEIYGE